MTKQDWIKTTIVIVALTTLGASFYFSDRNFKESLPAQTSTSTNQGACYVGGCSSQICSDTEGVASNCEYREEYACYQKTSICERQSTGECGWTPTTELAVCIADATKSLVLSPEGKPVEISFSSCGSMDTVSCFGSGARPLGRIENILLWDLITTGNQMRFGVESEVSGDPHYVVIINFKENGYDSADYDYFKKKVPGLFLERRKGD